MINGTSYFFFRCDLYVDDRYPDYFIAESVEDLFFRFGESFMRRYVNIVKLNEVTIEHINAVHTFLIQQIS